MECDKGFSSSYMILKPEEVKFLDLIHILFSSDIEKRKFVDSAKAKEENSLEHRWLIFISIVVQKMLQFSSKPLSFLGSLVEMWLNLLSSNGNFFRLLYNVLRGKVVIPDKTSATFISFIGNFDKRLELDKNIKRGDARYHAALSMMASKASYENEAYLRTIVNEHWKMEFLGFYNYWNDYQEKPTTQVFLFRDKTNEQDTVVVAFRGTEPFDADAWCSDFDISWYELKDIGRIHGGFMKALGLQKSIGWPKECIENNGGALAILFPAVLAYHGEKMLLERLEGVYTFGQPRVGDERFGLHMESNLKENRIPYYRFVYSNDMVPRLPYDDSALMFKHFGTCIYYDRHYQPQVVAEEPNKNYFSPLRAIPMMINAFMELIRSFTILYTKGPEYREGWFMRLFRLIGLAIPGVPPHCPQDYVNATRLGPVEVFHPPHEQPQNDFA
ncbi:triacylglycerol lipase OBL1 isoform X2 [Hevea brasiliensis]|uniref:triacylglycerol lipase OBL1 isoform X2 n=1 Tax=Hevea brasiliensis TaxID=3981 RepID=UPI0025FC2C30|nr:triacylglycerol lipase OBL1 isoform X2 [Hevea brasiliensis]